MRELDGREMRKRGCADCVFAKKKGWRYLCKRRKCPFRELDNYETYSDFLQSKDAPELSSGTFFR